MMTTTRRIAILGLVGVAGLAVADVARAQLFGKDKKKEDPTRTVKGIVTTEGEDPLKAVVQLKNERTLDVKSYYTDPQGRFFFAGLDPNVDYEVKAFTDGYQPKIRKVSSFDDRMELFYAMRLKKE